MPPTGLLKHEHQVILLVLNAARLEADSMHNAGRIPIPKIEQMIDFFRNFVGRCHHAKEERLLFPALERRGHSCESGPIATLLREHQEARHLLAGIARALPYPGEDRPVAAGPLQHFLLAYEQLLHAHIHKEDDTLFPMADLFLTPEDQHTLSEAFDKLEADEIGPGVHEKYHRLAHELAAPPDPSDQRPQ